MKRLFLVILLFLGVTMALPARAEFYDIAVKSIDGRDADLSEYRNKVVLVVNTASECGFTPQYEGLEKLYETYKDKGFVLLGMPCNQFGGQEPGTNAEIKAFCERRYGVTFPLLSKGDVKGPNQHPLYKFLLDGAGKEGNVGWNFEKFLVDREGKVVRHFSSNVAPEAPELVKAIEKEIRVTKSTSQ
ncbi:MAG TPA: glutathione peroxidase [bacterium]|nr:glutathione peroxidase [bacterium]